MLKVPPLNVKHFRYMLKGGFVKCEKGDLLNAKCEKGDPMNAKC